MIRNNKKIFSVKYLVFALCAVIFFAGGVIGYTKAEPNYTTDDYEADLETWNVAVSLVENGMALNQNAPILSGLPGALEPGKYYEDSLSVQNSGMLDEYVRVIIRKRWVEKNADVNGVKNPVRDLSPEYIGLVLSEGWIESPSESTKEKTVLYYSKPLKAGTGETVEFLKGLSIRSDVASVVDSQTDETGNITLTYRYNGVNFEISAEADAVQTGSAQDAILSAWGVEVNIAEDGTLSLPPTE